MEKLVQQHKAAEGAGISFRHPAAEDGAAVWAFIRDAGTLDLNSSYCYIMLCAYFSETCLIAEQDGLMVGFVSGYRIPGRENTLFIWQIAVSSAVRGQGLGRSLLVELIERQRSGSQSSLRPAFVPLEYVEATISPSNQASRALFESIAKHYGTACKLLPGIPAALFPAGQGHEAEPLYRIGPLNR